jgi:hypothetical protein
VVQLGQFEFSRIGPLAAAIEEESLWPPAPALITKMQLSMGACVCSNVSTQLALPCSRS